MKIGLALGGGSARGWSHIGVIEALSEYGITPEIICGTSIGSLVGAAYVSDNLKQLKVWTESLSKFETARFLEINTSLKGFVNKKRLHHFLNEHVADDDLLIESLAKKYAAVATDLESGREVWLNKGSVIDAVWSSISLPGLFPAIRSDNRWLVDGGLVNPVPISVCRALGADVVIAVNLNGDIVGKHIQKPFKEPNNGDRFVDKVTDFIADYTPSVFTSTEDKNTPPGLFESITSSINITQDRITRSRMAGDPPDILLAPKLSHIGLLEFYRASESISEGRACVQRMLPEIRHVFNETY